MKASAHQRPPTRLEYEVVGSEEQLAPTRNDPTAKTDLAPALSVTHTSGVLHEPVVPHLSTSEQTNQETTPGKVRKNIDDPLPGMTPRYNSTWRLRPKIKRPTRKTRIRKVQATSRPSKSYRERTKNIQRNPQPLKKPTIKTTHSGLTTRRSEQEQGNTRAA